MAPGDGVTETAGHGHPGIFQRTHGGAAAQLVLTERGQARRGRRVVAHARPRARLERARAGDAGGAQARARRRVRRGRPRLSPAERLRRLLPRGRQCPTLHDRRDAVGGAVRAARERARRGRALLGFPSRALGVRGRVLHLQRADGYRVQPATRRPRAARGHPRLRHALRRRHRSDPRRAGGCFVRRALDGGRALSQQRSRRPPSSPSSRRSFAG